MCESSINAKTFMSSSLSFLLFLVEERKKAGDPRDYFPRRPEMLSCILRISQFDAYLERSADDAIRFLLRHFARERLASKTINSLLAQNGEPELDKG